MPNISTFSNTWWDQGCKDALVTLRTDHGSSTFKAYKKAIRRARNKDFQNKICEAIFNHRPWDLLNMAKPCKLTAYTMLKQPNNDPIHSLDELWPSLDQCFSSASSCISSPVALQSLPQYPIRPWHTINPKEVCDTFKGHTTSSAPGPDYIRWHNLVPTVYNDEGATKLATLFSSCVSLSYWPMEFKDSLSVIIPKPKKPDYSSIKAYQPIALISCLDKLGSKILTNCLQFKATTNSIFYPCQFGSTIKHLTEDAGVRVVNKIRDGWVKGEVTTMMALDLAQFFPSINHSVLTHTLHSQGFNPLLVNFFSNFLADQWTTY